MAVDASCVYQVVPVQEGIWTFRVQLCHDPAPPNRGWRFPQVNYASSTDALRAAKEVMQQMQHQQYCSFTYQTRPGTEAHLL